MIERIKRKRKKKKTFQVKGQSQKAKPKILNFVQSCNTNYLQFSVNKTKQKVVDVRKKDTEIMPLKFNDQIIEQVSTYKYLVVAIDEKLKWSDHIDNINSKANKR